MSKAKRRVIHIVLTLALVGSGIMGLAALTASKSEIKKDLPPPPVPVVRTRAVEAGNLVIPIHGQGTVSALREISMVPQVSGKVVHMSPSLINGGEFQKGDVLLKIDPVDYELAVTLARAKVKDSESNLRIAEETAAMAVEEWREHVGGSGKERTPPPLVAKEPQLLAAQAKLDADRAELRKAVLNLDRTVIRAPFEGRVDSKRVDIGQYVTAGQNLATLFSTEAVEIVVPLEDADLQWFQVPGFTQGKGPGSEAVVGARLAGEERTWKGRVVRAEGKMDEESRMVRVVVRVERPYAARPPLAVGLFVTVDIRGDALPQAAVIPRAALRAGDMVWVVEDRTLKFRKVSVALVQGDRAVIAGGLSHGERVAVSGLKAVTDGMTVRPVAEEELEQS